MTGKFPDNPKRFNARFRRNVFRDATVPIVCDRNEYVWGFQIGPSGRHNNTSAGNGLEDMSLAFGDSVICCVILALRSFSRDQSTNLNTYFVNEYEAMNGVYLSLEDSEVDLKPFARLQELQELVEAGTLSVNVGAVDNCEMFRRRDDWFLSTEKPLQLSPSDDAFANVLID